MFAARPTAQLAEALRSELPGYAVALRAHAAGPDTERTPARVAQVMIADPHLEAVCWVDDETGVEVRVIVHVPFLGAAPAVLVGDSVASFADEVPADDTLATIARLIDEELGDACDDPYTHAAMEAGRLVYLNDWPG